MSGFFSLWDIQTGNIIGTYEWLEEALDITDNLIESFGTNYADALELSWTSDDNEQHRVIATGIALVAMARQAAAPRPAAAS